MTTGEGLASPTSETTCTSATGKIPDFPQIRKSTGQDILLHIYALSAHASASVLPIPITSHFGCSYVKDKSCHTGGETGAAQFSTAFEDLITINF